MTEYCRTEGGSALVFLHMEYINVFGMRFMSVVQGIPNDLHGPGLGLRLLQNDKISKHSLGHTSCQVQLKAQASAISNIYLTNNTAQIYRAIIIIICITT